MTNKKIFILPYKSGSQSAKALATSLGCKRIKLRNSNYRTRPHHVVINWGSTCRAGHNMACETNGLTLLNKPAAIRIAGCKLATFNCLSTASSSINIPTYTTSQSLATMWLEAGDTVVQRALLRGHSGAGITILTSASQIESAPLYVKYVPKKQEYRVHVVNGKVIDQQRKMRSREVADEDVNWKVRNHSNGFIFGREGVDLPPEALGMCIESVRVLGLDFGAVDMVWNERDDKYYVLEINTACGLTGTTLEKYTEAFKEMLCSE